MKAFLVALVVGACVALMVHTFGLAGASPAQSPASAKIWLTRAVDCEVIFSTPTTITMSLMPAATSAHPWKNAEPLEAQAASMRVEGTPSMPRAVET